MAASAPSLAGDSVPGAGSVPAAATVAAAKPKKKLKPGTTPEPEPEPEPAKPAIAPAKLPAAPPSKIVPVPQPADHSEEIARKAVWAAAGVAALFVLYLIADRFVAVVTRWPQTVVEAVAPAHCDQFINLAKTAYGEMWRVRLDPRDTTCDREIKNEWERQQLTRYVPPPASLAPPANAPAAASSAAVAAPQPVATRCLNVVSLAQAKYGADWRVKLAAEDPECAGVKRRKAEAPAVAAEAGTGAGVAPAAEPPATVEPARVEPVAAAPAEAQSAPPPAQ